MPPVSTRDALNYECPTHPVQVRLVLHTRYRARWECPYHHDEPHGFNDLPSSSLRRSLPPTLALRIEEAFKRLKHRLNLKHVSGLSQQAVMQQDLAAKVLGDNLQSLVCASAAQTEELTAHQRLNRIIAQAKLRHLIPAVLLAIQAYHVLHSTMADLAKNTHQHRPG